jgi:hypothetical protein
MYNQSWKEIETRLREQEVSEIGAIRRIKVLQDLEQKRVQDEQKARAGYDALLLKEQLRVLREKLPPKNTRRHDFHVEPSQVCGKRHVSLIQLNTESHDTYHGAGRS